MSDGILVQALGDFCKRYLGDSAVVVRGYVNRVSKPKTKSYVLVTPMTMTRLSTNLHQRSAAGQPSYSRSAAGYSSTSMGRPPPTAPKRSQRSCATAWGAASSRRTGLPPCTSKTRRT